MPRALDPAYIGLLAPVGYAMLLGVVLVDMLIDFSPETAWKEAYYAAHRTAPCPQRAFIPFAMALAIVGYVANVRKEALAAASAATIATGGGKPAPRDPRNVASGVLGVSIAAIFHRFLVPRQDWVAQVVVQNKQRLRLGPQIVEALAVIRRGHVAIAAILAALVVLQLAVAVERVVEARLKQQAGGGKGVNGSGPVSLLDEFGGGREKRNGRAKGPKTL